MIMGGSGVTAGSCPQQYLYSETGKLLVPPILSVTPLRKLLVVDSVIVKLEDLIVPFIC